MDSVSIINCPNPTCRSILTELMKYCDECGDELDPSLWKQKPLDTHACEGCCYVYPIKKKFCGQCREPNPEHPANKQSTSAIMQPVKEVGTLEPTPINELPGQTSENNPQESKNIENFHGCGDANKQYEHVTDKEYTEAIDKVNENTHNQNKSIPLDQVVELLQNHQLTTQESPDISKNKRSITDSELVEDGKKKSKIVESDQNLQKETKDLGNCKESKFSENEMLELDNVTQLLESQQIDGQQSPHRLTNKRSSIDSSVGDEQMAHKKNKLSETDVKISNSNNQPKENEDKTQLNEQKHAAFKNENVNHTRDEATSETKYDSEERGNEVGGVSTEEGEIENNTEGNGAENISSQYVQVFGEGIQQDNNQVNGDEGTPDVICTVSSRNIKEEATGSNNQESTTDALTNRSNDEPSGAKNKKDNNQQKKDTHSNQSQPYRKPDQAKEYVSGSGKDKRDPKTQSAKNSKAHKTFGSAKVSVYFHTLLPPSFKFTAGTDKVQLRSKNPYLGGDWKNPQQIHTMKITRTSKKGYLHLDYKLDIPKVALAGGAVVYYKYACVYGKGKVQFEFIYKDAGRDNIVNRYFTIPNNRLLEIDEWHVYDGIMHPEPEGGIKHWFSSKLGWHHKDVIEEVKKGAIAMLPRWEGFCFQGDNKKDATAQDVLDQIADIEHSLKPYLLQKNCKTYDELLFKQALHEYIRPRLDKLKNLQGHGSVNETPEEAGLRLASAMSIVWICVRFNLNYKTKDITKPLLFGLTLHSDNAKKTCDADNAKKTCDAYAMLIQHHFPSTYDNMAKYLRDFLNNMVTMTNSYGSYVDFCEPDWMRAIPVYHFLSKKSYPFIPTAPSSEHRTLEWWGLVGIDKLTDRFKKALLTDNIDLKYLFQVLTPMFEIDQLLPRTLLAVLSWSHLHDCLQHYCIDSAACLANLYFHLNSINYPADQDLRTLRDYLSLLHNTLMAELKEIKQIQSSLPQKAAECKAECDIALDFMGEVLRKCKKTYLHEVVESATSVVLDVVYKYQIVALKCEGENELDVTAINAAIVTYIKRLGDDLQSWLQDKLPYKMLICFPYTRIDDDNELKIFKWLLSVETHNDELKEWWQNKFVKYIEDRLQKERSASAKVELFCRIDCNQFHPLIEECFSKIAFSIIETGMENIYSECSFIFDLAAGNEGVKFRNLLSRMFESAWPKNENDQLGIVTHILTWPSFARYLKIFYGKEKSTRLLGEAAQSQMMIGISLFDQLWSNLKTGQIRMHLLKIIIDHTKNFAEICEVKDHTEKLTGKGFHQQFQQIVEYRKAEVARFKYLHQRLGVLLDFCKRVKKVNCKDLKEEIKHNTERVRLNELCKPQLLGSGPVQPNITFYSVSDSVLEILDDFEGIRESSTFTTNWTKNSHQLCRQKEQEEGEDFEITIDELVEHVWYKSVNGVKEVVNKLNMGTFTFAEVDANFDSFEERYEDMRAEIRTMCVGIKVDYKLPVQRVEKIKEYNKLKTYRQGAKIMKNIKDGFSLTGDFTVLDMLINAGDNKQKSLKDLTKDVVDMGQVLKIVNNQKAECIDVFLKAKPLVDWLRENVKDTKEIKVLVDLAMMSAQGQGAIEEARVSFLHTAAVGYAPLIYELKPDAGFKEFLHQCQQVWKSLESDPNLPVKLGDTARQLDWLKHVKDSHGSVEVDALSQAESINARGVYRVGCLDKTTSSILKSLEDVLVLKVPPEKKEDHNDSTKWKDYDYDKLKDLQSKLMLVAGKAAKGKEQVDRFMEIFDGITRLAKTYIKLCKAGSILFKNWNVMFYCEPERKVHTIVDFGLSENTMQGTTDTCRNVSMQIVQLCKFMDTCLNQWQKDIEDKRGQFYFLNHFTTEQLVILRREMANLCCEDQNQKVKNEIYGMLSFVKTDCSEQDLKEAFHSAMSDLATTHTMKDVDMEDANDEITMETNDLSPPVDQQTDSNELNSQVAPCYDKMLLVNYLQQLKYAGFSTKLAMKALQAPEVSGPDKIEEATMWCLEHDQDDDSIEEDNEMSQTSLSPRQQTPANSEPQSPTSPHTDTFSFAQSNIDLETKKTYSNILKNYTLEDLTRGLLEDTKKDSNLKDQLQCLWDEYIKSATVASVSDFLSVEHLGYILEHLAVKFTDTSLLNRPVPNYLSIGKPNLIVCPQSEMMQTVLSIYMYENGSQIPLPTADEVLLCTEHTRLEEVELLWRRAFGIYKQEKIFCLLNADRLDYEVSKKAEEKFEKISKGIQDYRLVVICSREREDKSNIVTAFERHRIKNPFLYPTYAIGQYLHAHYQIQQRTLVPAANIDPQKCSVRVIKSERAGVGKTLKVQRFAQQMKQIYAHHTPVYVSLHRKIVDISEVLRQLLKKTAHPSRPVPKLFHIDIAHEVLDGVDDLLFNLLVLGSLTDQQGFVWLKSDLDLYLIEVMPLVQKDTNARGFGRLIPVADEKVKYVHQMLHYLPSLMCWSPTNSLDILQKTQGNMAVKLADHPEFQSHDQLMDQAELESVEWQRVFQYLQCYSTQQNLDQVNPTIPQGTAEQCLQILLRYCGIQDPSWAELRHFVWFLNIQLLDCDNSSFCSFGAAEDLPGFKIFVVKSMIQMSRDFATRSLIISEQTPGFQQRMGQADDDDIELFQMKRQWETSPHPYVFFNHDRHSMTFMGFNIDLAGNMVDQRTNGVLEPNVMPKPLQDALKRNRVPLNENFDNLPRHEKILKLCQVMGNELQHDPDSSYVLTTDNTKKILAIYMRFRCGIPVIIMGETGCGKTRLIKFMCDIQKPPGAEIKNMILMKVHGGTTENDIRKKLQTALELANKNRQDYKNIDTVLFFDEANTTEEIGLIKQVMCDQKVLGAHQHGLRIVAACNPYRKHSEEMIRKLEQAGLGYHIEADQTTDKLGRIPMRRLVYRVQALPQSMLPLVWDFGQLNTDTEQSYIEQMVNKFIVDDQLPNLGNLQVAVSRVLTASQDFMREQEDECSFVSLRDVERTLSVMAWFYQHSDPLFYMMDEMSKQQIFEKDGDVEEEFQEVEEVTRSLILALGVCYHACLEKREEYRQHVAKYFGAPLALPNGHETIREDIGRCQDIFLNHVKLEDNIARNQALKENVFMMVVCIELRIPLFLVGKPGSSKSLAKTIVADAMQGDAAKTDLFKQLKLVHMVSYQCSPLSTPDGIVSTFRQCAGLQKGKDLDAFVSVVVLDEIGLAEDSPRMPLKALHPLLEDGCEGEEKPEPHKKVAFIGISNWALDPAKMNRGILVQRGVPDDEELQDSAEGICAQNHTVQNKIRPFLRPMAQAYLDLYNSALEIREFFGLRDFYSIIKMVYNFSKRSGKPPTWFELKHAILRNFGGLDKVKPLEVFEKRLQGIEKNAEQTPFDPDCSPQGLIKACLFGEGLEGINSESRYLLILTENYAALKILQQQLVQLKDAIYIFGSSFPKDQEYTQVCRNINRIKICMQTGQKVVLLNLDNLYESLYDALNQYYVEFGGERFVDLGLGSHRVKCKVHKDFRLIVVAEKQVVYQKFPIPLINRLEKHTLTMETVLTEEQLELAQQLDTWAEAFATVDTTGVRRDRKFEVGDVFIGYDKDTAASIVLQVSRKEDSPLEILNESKSILLQCAAPEAIIRLKKSRLRQEEERWTEVYFRQQQHTSLQQYLLANLNKEQYSEHSLFVQVTTHSKLLSRADVHQISTKLDLKKTDVRMESLQEFDTEQQFCKQLSEYFSLPDSSDKLLFIQCDSGDENATLIASAQYSIVREHRNQMQMLVETDQDEDNLKTMYQSIADVNPANLGKRHVVFVIQLPRKPGGCFIGFQGGEWTSYHIDELRPTGESLPSLSKLNELSLSRLFGNALKIKNNPKQVSQSKEQNAETTYNIYEDMPLLEGHTEEDYVNLGLRAPHQGNGDVESMDTNDEPHSSPSISNMGDSSMGSFSVVGSSMTTYNDGMQVTEEAMDIDSPNNELDIDTIIRDCIHGAAAMLEDESEGQRKTYRVQLMLKLMARKSKDKSQPSFLDIVKKRLWLLLQDKEQTASTSDWARQWLTNEAASQEAVTRAGTFVRSIWQNIEAKVTPLLAGVMAYCDANNNLDLLMHVQTQEWLAKYWLQMFNSEKVARLSYEDLQTASQRREVERILVSRHGYQGTSFVCRLPFSWIIKQQVDLLMHSQKKGQLKDNDNTDSLALVSKLFNESQLGQIISNTVGEEIEHGYNEFVQLYISDYVQMVYKCQSTNPEVESKLIEDSIQIAAKENHNMSTYLQNEADDQLIDHTPDHTPEFALTIPVVHKTFDSLQNRIQLFGQAVATWPGAVEKIQKFKEDSPNNPLNHSQEFTLDVLILYFILEHMAPVNDEINQTDSRLKWLEKVEKLRPIIERMIETIHIPGSHPYGEKCMNYLDNCRSMWSRVCAVQLFIEHVCPRGEKESKLSTKKCMPLWTMLGANANFKKVESMSKVENFLKVCNGKATELYFGNNLQKCGGCENPMTDPVKLPCKDKHVVCNVCIMTFIQMDQRQCPLCRQDLPDDFKPEVRKQNKEARTSYYQYKQRCNSFFMDLVSRLCFAGDTPPSREVIQKLLGYVTKESQIDSEDGGPVVTQQIMVLQGTIDPTPVVRSFLLQHLLRSHVDEVRCYLNDYFIKSRRIAKDKSDHLIQLSLLFVYCLEDAYHTRYKQNVDKSRAIRQVRDIVQDAADTISGIGLSVEKLEAISGARFGLHIASEWMHRVHVSKDKVQHVSEVRKLFDKAADLCGQEQLKWPRLYLLRQLYRRYGVDTLIKVSEVHYLHWVLPREARQTQNVIQPDRLVVCGTDYKAIREALTQALLASDMSKVDEALGQIRSTDAIKQRNILLAIYTEVTLSNRHNEEHKKIKDESLNALHGYINASKIVSNKQMAVGLFNNNLANNCKHLTARMNANIKECMLSEAVVHIFIALSDQAKTKLMQPLLTFMENPAKMANCWLPTMPYTDIESIMQSGITQGMQVYSCPNGHGYVIGECGRPLHLGRCSVCKAEIGGTGHNPAAGNTKANALINKQLSTGHILGQANQRSRVPIPERGLSPAAVAVLRFFTHVAMYIGANNNSQAISPLIVPNINHTHVPQFLWEHMMVDLDVLSKAINRSFDDSVLIIHSIVDTFGKIGENLGPAPSLQNNNSRQDWERRFSTVYIAPMLQGIEARIQAANHQLVNDNRLGNNPLLKILYEADVAKDNENIQQMERAPALWTMRSRVTIEDLSQVLSECQGEQMKQKRGGGKKTVNNYPILKLFLKHEPLLRAVRFLPQITRLQRLLVHKFHGAIDRAEATEITVNKFLQKLPQGPIQEEFQDLIDAFSEAWTLIKEHISTFDFTGPRIPIEYTSVQVDGNTPLAMLLPSWKDHGRCSIATIHFLAAVQNDFLENYGRIIKQSFSGQTSSHEASSAHLVSYHPDRDLLPMVLANSNYSLNVGQSTSHQYDFEGLQKQIEERLIKGKTLVRSDILTVVFRADFTNASVFETLRKKIKQEPLDSTLQLQIISESCQLTEINDSMAMLDIAIGFLVSGTYKPETQLRDFLSKTLEMKKVLHSVKAMQQCCLKHVQTLWLLLSQERAKIQAKYGQDAFDNVADKYQEVLPADQIGLLHTMFQHTNVDIFMTELYECIMLHIAVPQDENEKDYNDNREHPLSYVLNEYIEAREENIHGDIIDREPVLPALAEDRFPAGLQLKHCVHTWLEAYNFIKIIGGRR